MSMDQRLMTFSEVGHEIRELPKPLFLPHAWVPDAKNKAAVEVCNVAFFAGHPQEPESKLVANWAMRSDYREAVLSEKPDLSLYATHLTVTLEDSTITREEPEAEVTLFVSGYPPKKEQQS